MGMAAILQFAIATATGHLNETHVISELKPDVIIEFSLGSGRSAIWLADLN
jgi:cephalosporin hydroxylase